jgi:hypothetical protein
LRTLKPTDEPTRRLRQHPKNEANNDKKDDGQVLREINHDTLQD